MPRRPKSIILAGAHEAVDPWSDGVDHLRQLDPKWAAIIEAVGPCRLVVRPDRFGTLVRAIIGQQISSKAAGSIDRKLRELAGEPHSPQPLIALGEEGLRSVGLSGVKARYVLNLSHAVRDGHVPLDEVHAWEDEAIINALTSIKGIGNWTAEMFLIFALEGPTYSHRETSEFALASRAFMGWRRSPNPANARPWPNLGDRSGPSRCGISGNRSITRRRRIEFREKPVDYDLIFKGGWVIDGSGGPAYRADVAIANETISEVGFLQDLTARKVIDVSGLYVVPGFIDAHVHGDLMLLADPVHLPALRQGVTTYIIGQDGCSFAPGSKSTIDSMRQYTAGFNGNPSNIDYDWDSIESYLARFDRQVAINVAYLIPNGNVRIEVMGHDARPASDDELKAMQRLVRQGMDAGAVGLSTGLDYLPSKHADAREIAALCEAIVPDNGVYVTHMRAYGQNAPIGMEEVYEIARRSGVAAHISHYNGPAHILLPLIDEGLAKGHDLTYDTYPYLAGSTILGMVALPAWVQEGGNEPTLERLALPAIRERLKSEWFTAPTQYPLDKMHLAMVADPSWEWAEGLTVTEAAEKAGSTACDFICEILLASNLAVGVVNFRANDRTEEDVRAILRHPSHMAGSDGIFRGGFPHPRGWGAFARYLGYHTRTLGDYNWPEAITHLSTHAARRYRLTDRGLIRRGFVADIAVFDPLTVTDRSTYSAGRTLAEGVKHVVVNGTLALEDGEPTGAKPGRALRRG